MTTIGQFLADKDLLDKWCTYALIWRKKRSNGSFMVIEDVLNSTVTDYFINKSFDWGIDSPQSFTFWNDLYNELQDLHYRELTQNDLI